jgi:hypothetical protein
MLRFFSYCELEAAIHGVDRDHASKLPRRCAPRRDGSIQRIVKESIVMAGRPVASARAAALALVLLAYGAGVCAQPFVRDDIITDPVPSRFSVCHGNGCVNLDFLSLDGAQWNSIRDLFEPPPESAQDERERLRIYLARMETIVGARTGTQTDLGGTFPGLGKSGQMDCIDESINTTLYLRMLAGEGLLNHHTVGKPATRGYFLFGWPHTTAVIAERDGGEAYAVDSWFEDNGRAPHILLLREWRRGWEPRQE